MEMMMMSSRYSGPACWDPCCADHDDKATGGVVGDGGDAGFFEMFGDLHSSGSGDLFELVWQGGGPAGRSCTPETQAGGPSSLPPADQPPSEYEMAAWLYAIVRGEVEPAVVGGIDKHAGGGVAGCAPEEDQLVPTAMEATKTEVKCTEDTVSNCTERGQQRGGRKSRHSEAHNLTEKRRRRKINEKFKTLQQLVPGCNNKSNQTSTLEQTIKYMKSLQHQIQQTMSFGCRIKQASAVVPPAAVAFAPGVLVTGHVWPGVVLGPPPPAILPFAATLPLLPHPAAHTVQQGSAAAVAALPERWPNYC